MILVDGVMIEDDGRAGPPPEAPSVESLRAAMVVSAFQARAALLAAGKLDDAEAAVAAAPRPVQIAWEYAVEFRRTSPTMLALAPALGLDDAALDDLFRQAAQISA